MSAKDPVDALLGSLAPVEPPRGAQPQLHRAFENHAEEAKKTTAPAWRAWSRWVEPALVAIFALILLVWAISKVLAG